MIASNLSKASILIVEDESIVALDIQLRLESIGYQVVGVADTGELAIDKARTTHPDLILMDIKLKGEMDGIQAAGMIQNLLNLPVIFLTAFADEATLQRACITEAFGYILKPFEERELSTNIEMALYKHRADCKLRETNDTLKALINVSPISITMTDESGAVRLWNPAAERLFGLQEAELIGQPLPYVPVDGSEEYLAIRGRVLQGEIIHDREVRRQKKDGSMAEINLSAVTIPSAPGRPSSIINFLQDITARKRTELLLQTLNSAALDLQHATSTSLIFQAVASQLLKMGIVAMIYSFDPATHSMTLIDTSHPAPHVKAVEDNFGIQIKKSFTVSSKLTGAFHQVFVEKKSIFVENSLEILRLRFAENPNLLFEPIAALLGETSSIYAPLLFGDEVIGMLVVHSNELKERDLPGVTAFAHQLAAAWQRVQLFEQVRQLNADLEARVEERTASLVSTIKELEAFSYTISHDLRTPLRAIDGYTKILTDDYHEKLDVEGMRLAQVVRSETQRMGVLIDELLAYTRLQTADLHSTDLDMQEMANLALEALTRTENRGRLDLQVGALPRARGDTKMIYQVWANLLSNALKFSSRQPRAEIEIGSLVSGSETIYFVKDNGMGFDSNYTSQLFGVFNRLQYNRDFPGTGMGLAIVKRIIERHKGRVWAESSLDQGATFYFTLPGDNGQQQQSA